MAGAAGALLVLAAGWLTERAFLGSNEAEARDRTEAAVRADFDPHDLFLNDHLRMLLA